MRLTNLTRRARRVNTAGGQQIVTAQDARDEMWTEKWIHGTTGAPQQAITISWFSSTMACTEMKISPSYSAWSYY